MARTDTLGHFLTDVADAIREKKGTVNTILASDFDTEIGSISGGGQPEPIEEKDANFYDYDGKLLYSYSASDFLELTALPANPTHDHLNSQGWNWSLQDAKTQITQYGKACIGQTYTTKNNSTNIYITLEEGRLSPYLGISVVGTVTIDWGDGSNTEDVTGTSAANIYTQHTYAQPGDYVIKLTSEASSFTLPGNIYGSLVLVKSSQEHNNNNQEFDRVYQAAIKKIELGTNATPGSYCFRYCINLSTVLIPAGGKPMSYYMFGGCNCLYALIIPHNMTTERFVVHGVGSLRIVSLPASVTSLGQGFFQESGIHTVVLPYTLTGIGNNVFSGCAQLKSIKLLPNTTINQQAFTYCSCLQKIDIPTSMTELPSFLFQNCISIAKFTIPSGITSIKSGCFNTCRGAKIFDFSHHTSVPTLQNTSAFSNAPDEYQILVPSSLYNEWIATDNWSSISSHIVSV